MWAHPGGCRREICSGASWPAGDLGQEWECGWITGDRKMQHKGRGVYIYTAQNCISRQNTTLHKSVPWGPGLLSSAQAGSEARPGDGGRSTGQNSVLPAHSVLRPSFTSAERVPSVRSLRNRPVARQTGRVARRRRAESGESATARSALSKGTSAASPRRARGNVPPGENRGRNDREEEQQRNRGCVHAVPERAASGRRLPPGRRWARPAEPRHPRAVKKWCGGRAPRGRKAPEKRTRGR